VRINTTISVVLLTLAAGVAPGQTAPYRVVNGQTDSDGFPISAARICVGSANTEQCYSPPAPKPPSPPFGLNATATDLKLATGVSLIVFTAESSIGGSGSLTNIALLADRNGQLIDLLPNITVTNQSEYRFWNLPAISGMPILTTADFVWGQVETHFSSHRYRITSYVYHKQGGRYVQLDEYITQKRYAGLDDANEIKVLEPEKATILHRLRSPSR